MLTATREAVATNQTRPTVDCQCPGHAEPLRGTHRTGKPVAARFEAYFQGVELANGYWEECCPVTLSERFNEDNKKQKQELQKYCLHEKHNR